MREMASDPLYIFSGYRTLKDQHAILIQVQTSLKKHNSIERKIGNSLTNFLELIIKMCVTRHIFI